MKKIFEEYGGVIQVTIAIVAIIAIIALLLAGPTGGWIGNAFKSTIDKFGDKVDEAIDIAPARVLNEYGFYYEAPYVGEFPVDGSTMMPLAFVLYEDNTVAMFATDMMGENNQSILDASDIGNWISQMSLSAEYSDGAATIDGIPIVFSEDGTVCTIPEAAFGVAFEYVLSDEKCHGVYFGDVYTCDDYTNEDIYGSTIVFDESGSFAQTGGAPKINVDSGYALPWTVGNHYVEYRYSYGDGEHYDTRRIYVTLDGETIYMDGTLYKRDALSNTTTDLTPSGTLPLGGFFTSADGSVNLSGGDEFPATFSEGDTYRESDYQYSYIESIDGWRVHKKADFDQYKETYSPILESIEDKPILELYETFVGCSNMVEAPAIPDTVTTLTGTFHGCEALTTVTIPDSVTTVGAYAFNSCDSLTSVDIPDSVATIGADAFASASGLSNATIPDSVTSIGSYAFAGSDLSGELVLKNVTTIGAAAFHNTQLTSVKLTNTTTIGNEAFAHCGELENVQLPNSLVELGDKAFYNCDKLTSITIPGNNAVIGEQAFYDCDGLKSVEISGVVSDIQSQAFNHCDSLESVAISGNVQGFTGVNHFGCCDNLTEVIVSGHAEVLYGFADDTNLKTVTISGTVDEIGTQAFSHCTGLTNINFPNSLTFIGARAFAGCDSLTIVNLPDGLTKLGSSAFEACDGLTTVNIPDSITTISTYAFYGCENLVSITFEGTMEQWKAILKQDGWNEYVPATEVVCKDGTVTL